MLIQLLFFFCCVRFHLSKLSKVQHLTAKDYLWTVSKGLFSLDAGFTDWQTNHNMIPGFLQFIRKNSPTEQLKIKQNEPHLSVGTGELLKLQTFYYLIIYQY